ncbi:alpha/beta hydrolase [Ectobacillus ponti]|uniref:Lysophospholipase n=1 Tax=Ectobacillus ponti TaxID=2961894 RepID=A0AA41XAW0_9BACI|nr:alpha/beta hydrolase [Ectobacillus ponti]MCP8969473.1 lysophospholipase [Ectobacillus ponti]
MEQHRFTISRPDDIQLSVQRWSGTEQPWAIVQIAHGMAEHVSRYDAFAHFLVSKGVAVYGNDHRGHGRTAAAAGDIGYFADEAGFEKVVEDMHAVTERIQQENPGIPIVLFGHSMGSFLARRYVQLYGKEVRGLILSGTGDNPPFLLKLGKLIAGMEKRIRGSRARSHVLNEISFGQFNRSFKPNRTPFDWLSSDSEAVDAYIQDPLCGGIFTAGFFYDLFTGSEAIMDKRGIASVPKQLPVFFVSGSLDPVGQQTKGVLHAYQAFVEAGLQDVSCKLYPEGRHEMLHEVNREEVHEDIWQWLRAKL